MYLCHKNLHQYPGLELITICQRVDYIYRIGTAYVEDFEKGQAYNISSFPNSPYLAVKRHGHGWSISTKSGSLRFSQFSSC
jgi:hypothetical protein